MIRLKIELLDLPDTKNPINDIKAWENITTLAYISKNSLFVLDFELLLDELSSFDEGGFWEGLEISILHELSHPSPSIRLPSSHCSVPLTKPSPQSGVQTLGVELEPAEQVKPVSNAVQDEFHPSSSDVLPSSQVSPASTLESPQTAIETLQLEEPGALTCPPGQVCHVPDLELEYVLAGQVEHVSDSAGLIVPAGQSSHSDLSALAKVPIFIVKRNLDSDFY